eukprot:6184829-Pleurochrysis_carterae.AAC.1
MGVSVHMQPGARRARGRSCPFRKILTALTIPSRFVSSTVPIIQHSRNAQNASTCAWNYVAELLEKGHDSASVEAKEMKQSKAFRVVHAATLRTGQQQTFRRTARCTF